MKTKQLLEVALKIVAFIMALPVLLNVPLYLQQNIEAYMSDSGPDISFSPFAGLALCLILVYFVLFRTEIIVNWIYKEKPDEQELKFNVPRVNAIFFSIVLISLYRLSSLVPDFIIFYVRSRNAELFDDIAFTYTDNKYLFNQGVQIVLLVIILINAKRITTWLEFYRRRQMKSMNTDATSE